MGSEIRPFVTEAAEVLPAEVLLCDGMFGRVTPHAADEHRAKEQPWHILAARCFAQGMTNVEVAGVCEVDRASIVHLLKNQWFQARIEQFMSEFSKDMNDRIKAESFACITVLTELRDAKTTPPTVKANICFNLLDRHLGKATQRVEVQGVPTSSDPVAECERLEREIAAHGQAN